MTGRLTRRLRQHDSWGKEAVEVARQDLQKQHVYEIIFEAAWWATYSTPKLRVGGALHGESVFCLLRSLLKLLQTSNSWEHVAHLTCAETKETSLCRCQVFRYTLPGNKTLLEWKREIIWDIWGEWLHFYSHGWFHLNWLMDKLPPPSLSHHYCCWQSVPPSMEPSPVRPSAPRLLTSFPSAERLCLSQAIVSMINLFVSALATVGNNTSSCFGSRLANVFPLWWKMSLHFFFLQRE